VLTQPDITKPFDIYCDASGTGLGGVLMQEGVIPRSEKEERSLHTCAQDVQITRTANNMVNRYNISLNYKLESLQNDPWVQKETLQSGAEI
jgi:hypothetical protein